MLMLQMLVLKMLKKYIYVYILWYWWNKTTWVGTNSFMSSQSFSQLITVNLQYNGIKITKQCSDVNCVKSIRIQGWSGPHFATFWVNTRTCFVNLLTQSKCGKKVAPEKIQIESFWQGWHKTSKKPYFHCGPSSRTSSK